MLPVLLTVGAEAGPLAGRGRRIDFAGFKPFAVDSLRAALAIVRQWRFDAILVDADRFAGALVVALPELRRHAAAPIVLLWSELDERRQIESLESGATAIVSKPASARLVAAKLRGLLLPGSAPARRALELASPALAEPARETVSVGPLRLDPRSAVAEVAGRAIALTVSEFDLLLLLATRPGEFVDRARIASVLRAPPADTTSRSGRRRSPDMHVCRLRRKLSGASAGELRIDTVYGRGYCLAV